VFDDIPSNYFVVTPFNHALPMRVFSMPGNLEPFWQTLQFILSIFITEQTACKLLVIHKSFFYFSSFCKE